MSQTTTLLVDDQDSQIQYLCDSLNEHVATGSYYNSTWTTIKSGNCSSGWFDYTFYGTGISVAASVAAPGASYSVKIDSGDFVPQSGNGAYDSPTLSDGKHTITYAIVSNGQSLPAFDYLTVTPGSSTPLEGQTLAVDDTDESIVYSGGWKNSPSVPLSFDYSNSLHRDTTQWSSSVGDSLQFQFEGSSISVFGIATNISVGNIAANYTLDGVSKVQGLPQGALDSLPMVNLFHADVQPGVHTLIMNITHIQAPQTLGIDLITYNASFNSISSLSTTGRKSSDALDAGSKVGITIGVLACVALVASLVIFLGRRYIRNRNTKFPEYHSLESAAKKSLRYS
jgi:hypothetical protein